jgi:hypothetical protein
VLTLAKETCAQLELFEPERRRSRRKESPINRHVQMLPGNMPDRHDAGDKTASTDPKGSAALISQLEESKFVGLLRPYP